MNRAGKSTLPSARVRVTRPDSSGWRMPWRTDGAELGEARRGTARRRSRAISRRDARASRRRPAPPTWPSGAGGRAAAPRPGSASTSSPATERTTAVSTALGLRQRRQDGRQPRREHGLARTGRSRHQHAVAARRRDLQGALRHVVAGDGPGSQARAHCSASPRRPRPGTGPYLDPASDFAARRTNRRARRNPVTRQEYQVDVLVAARTARSQQPGHRAHRLERSSPTNSWPWTARGSDSPKRTGCPPRWQVEP